MAYSLWNVPKLDEEWLVEFLSNMMIGTALITMAGFLIYKPRSAELFPYGRFFSAEASRFAVPAKLAWHLMALPSLVIPLLAIWQVGLDNIPLANKILLAMLLLHYAIRSLVFPLLIRNGKPYPLMLFLTGVILLSWNGFIQGFQHAKYSHLPSDCLHSFGHLIGIPIFLVGLCINHTSDYHLCRLRSPTESDYKVPYGGLFEWVSCPNYFGELLIWLGFWLFARTGAALGILLLTISNIVPRALDTHKWYNARFKDYPVQRKAIIPFLL